jgi:hypothetical protein
MEKTLGCLGFTLAGEPGGGDGGYEGGGGCDKYL